MAFICGDLKKIDKIEPTPPITDHGFRPGDWVEYKGHGGMEITETYTLNGADWALCKKREGKSWRYSSYAISGLEKSDKPRL